MRVYLRKSTLGRLLLSYLLVLVIPLSGLIISFTYTNHVVYNETRSSKQISLNAVANRIDNVLMQLKTVSEGLLSSKPILKTAGLQESGSGFYISLQDSLQAIADFENNGSNFEILVFMRDKQFVLTAYTSNPAPALGSTLRLIRESEYSAEEFTDFMNTTAFAGRFEISGKYRYRNISNQENDSIAYIRTLNTQYRSLRDRGITVFISISIDDVLALAGLGSSADDIFLLTDDNGRILYNTSLPDESGAFVTDLRFSGSDISVSVGDTDYFGCVLDSEVTDWRYAIIAPESRFWAARNVVTNICLVAILSALFGGIILSIVLSKRTYSPIEDTLNFMHMSAGSGENEFELIQSAWFSMQKEKDSIESTLYSQSDTFRKHYLLSYIQGNDSILTDDDMLSYLDIDTKDKMFALVGFLVKDLESVQGNPKSSLLQQELVYSRIGRAFSSLVTEKYPACDLRSPIIQLWLITLSPAQTPMYRENIEEIVRSVLDNAGIQMSVFISDAAGTLRNLRPAYTNMLKYSEYHYASDDIGIVYIDSKPQAYEPVQVLYESMLTGRPSDALALFSSMLADAGSDILGVRLSALDIVKQIMNCGHSAQLNMPGLEKCVSSIANAQTRDDIIRYFSKYLLSLCGDAEAGEIQSSVSDELTARIEEFVNKNYSDMNLSLNMISDNFDFSAKYLSALYKSKSGRSLLDYIRQVRITEAQRLINETDMTMADVAEKVGYNNLKTFRRDYVRVEGGTPSQSRASK